MSAASRSVWLIEKDRVCRSLPITQVRKRSVNEIYSELSVAAEQNCSDLPAEWSRSND